MFNATFSHAPRKFAITLSLLSATALSPVGNAHAQSAFEIPGTLGGTYARGYAISANGSVMVGRSSLQQLSSDFHAFSWTPGGGMVDLGTLGGDFSSANDVSGDGSTIVGFAHLGSGMSRAFRYRAGTGMVSLGTLGGLFSEATGVSLDGTVIVGTSSGSGGGSSHAFRWLEGAVGGVAGNPQMFDLGVLPGGAFSYAHAVSNDGSVVVGRSDVAGFNMHAFRWTEATGMVDIGTLAGGGDYSEAYGISGDGNVIVGQSDWGDINGTSEHAFRWTEADGMIDLGTFGGDDSAANAASLDGTVVVGWADDSDDSVAFRWTDATGMVSVEDWLGNAGIDVNDWNLYTAEDVSDDGTVVVGSAENPDGDDRAYLARVSSLGSGVIDVADYTASLYSATSLSYAGQHLSWLPLTGAHHRPLMDYAGLGGDKCFWANGDFGVYGGNRNTAIGLAEAGFCADFGDAFRAGIGIGKSFSTQGLPNSGTSNLDGQYILGEIDWAPEGTPLLFSGTALFGNSRADIRRGYLNGGGIDHSTGQTAVNAAVIRGRVDWLDAAAFGTTTLSPWASFTLANTRVDGYTETGGGFPARFDAQSQTSAELRVGVSAETTLSEQTTLRATIEGVHRFGSSGPALTGQTLGLFAFALPGQSQGQTWARIGVDIEHEFSSTVLGTLTLQAATAGQDPDLSGAIGLRVAM